MAEIALESHLDLVGNEIKNVVLYRLSAHPSISGKLPGWVYFNTTDKTVYCYSGKPDEIDWWLDLGNLYVHPITGAISPTLTGANVLATLIVNDKGHVTGATTRVMTLANLGFTGDANANYYVHPTFTGNSLGGVLAGAVVISNIGVNAEGHVTGFNTRSLTPADIGASALGHLHTLASGATDVTATAAEVNLLDLAGLTTGWVLKATSATTAAWGKLLGSHITNDLNWVKIADALTNATDTWSSQKIQLLIDEIYSAITGGFINKGGYDATANSPDLDVAPSALIKNGWAYVVSSPGTFFTEAVAAGDMLIAKQDAPTTLAHWTVVNKNIPDIVQGTTSQLGILQLASDLEVQTGTDTAKAITSSNLSARVATETRTGILALATSAEGIAGTEATKAVTSAVLKAVLDDRVGGYTVLFGNGSANSFNISHGLNTRILTITVYNEATGKEVLMEKGPISTSQVNIACNSTPSTNQYRAVIKK